jgi:hypothetical protein
MFLKSSLTSGLLLGTSGERIFDAAFGSQRRKALRDGTRKDHVRYQRMAV